MTEPLATLAQRGFSYALSLTHDRVAAEDLLQDAWAGVIRAGGPRTRPYLFRAIRSRWIDGYRRRQVVDFEAISEPVRDRGPDPRDTDRAALDRALATLRPEDALRAHYADRLPPGEEAALVAQASTETRPWMPLLIGLVAAVVLWWAASVRPPTTESPAALPEVQIESSIQLVSLFYAAPAIDGVPADADSLVLLPRWPEVPPEAVVANPTVIALSGQRAQVAWTDPDGGTTSVALTVTEAGLAWEVEVALTLPSHDEPLTWSGTRPGHSLSLPLLARTQETTWMLLIDVDPILAGP